LTSPALGLLFGFLNTAALHVAKGMQQQGINALRWRRLPAELRHGRTLWIYIAGVVLNNSAPVWLILTNRFAAPAYATGMFGIGIVLLLIYSVMILGERVSALNFAGAAIVVVGTVLFGVHAIRLGDVDLSAIQRETVIQFILIFLGLGIFAVAAAFRLRSPVAASFAFAFYAGGAACLDPFLKAIGQTAAGTATLLPVGWAGWLPFLFSFALGSSAFVVVQVAFLRGARASVFVPFQSIIYVLVPVVLQLIALPGYRASAVLVVGVVFILAGIVLMQVGRRTPSPLAGESK
jgi:multidrug transporter EmrE-like cation transporter